MAEIGYYYKILGLEPGSSLEEIKQAYRDLVKVWHPDRFPNDLRLQHKAQEKLKEINYAYKFLVELHVDPKFANSWHRRHEASGVRGGYGYQPHEAPKPPPKSHDIDESSYTQGSTWPAVGWLKRLWAFVRLYPALTSIIFYLVVASIGLFIESRNNDPQRVTPKVSNEPKGNTATVPHKPNYTPSPSLNAKNLSVRPPVSFPNGTNIIKPRGPKGLSSLRVINGTNRDAVVKLVSATTTRKVLRFVYVRAGKEINIKNISPSTYLLRFSSGVDWDRVSRKFLRERSYSVFDKPLVFIEQEMADGIKYNTIEITLHPVVGGNVRTSEISEAEFEEGT